MEQGRASRGARKRMAWGGRKMEVHKWGGEENLVVKARWDPEGRVVERLLRALKWV